MNVLDSQIYYPLFAFFLFFLVLAFVPRAEIKKLFWFSLLWGSTVDSIIIFLMRRLNLFHYIKLEPFNLFGVPLWIPLAWSQAIILFIYFYPNRKEWYYNLFYIAFFAGAGVGIGFFFSQAGLIVNVRWNELFRFPIQFLWFYGALKHYQYLEGSAAQENPAS